MGPPLQQQEVEDLATVLGKHLGIPGSLVYRATVVGNVSSKHITDNVQILLALRAVRTHVNQSTMKLAVLKVADDKKSSWALAGETDKFAEETAIQLRAMLRDISQGLLKIKDDKKTPDWLKPFSEATLAENFAFQYDPEMRSAYKVSRVGTKGKRIYCDKMEDPSHEVSSPNAFEVTCYVGSAFFACASCERWGPNRPPQR